jgi:AIPR protein/abortive infection phage resistance-like protein
VTDSDIGIFAGEFQQDLRDEASRAGAPRMIRDVFVERMVSELVEAGELESGTACFHQASGRAVEVSGYNISADGETLDLFGVNLTQSRTPVTVPKSKIETSVRRLLRFLDRARAQGYKDREEASEVFDMFLTIDQTWPRVVEVRLFLFTDGITNFDRVAEEDVDGRSITLHMWDLRRLHRLLTSGRKQEPVQVDFETEFGQPLRCLETTSATAHRTLLAVVPGDVLKSIYGKFGPRLLELNVRSFLQSRGKVNQGIRRTILDEPDRFMAYNNGISATASDVKIVQSDDGGTVIKSIQDLQIVNGGQTTASLYYTAKKDKADLSHVFVQMKLTVVDSDQLDDVVPLISRYANSQNAVSEADFSSNSPFHVQIEKLSRSVWAPARSGSQVQTRWFYERARGQYQDAITREATNARQRQFKEIHPAGQKISKTDLAKFEMSWQQKPHIVSLGAQKCFREFTLATDEAGMPVVDRKYFEDLVAKAILFRRAERVIASLRLGDYRANVVTYTLALISNRHNDVVDLTEIWRKQELHQETVDLIRVLAPTIFRVLVEAPGNRNVTEWAKKLDCWERVLKIPDLK